MAIGIRIRGGANQLQISEENPVYMILAEGVINSSQKILHTSPQGTYLGMQHVHFPFTITTNEPPLVFIRIYNMIVIRGVTIMGSPGAWTGFLIGSGIGVNIDLSADGDWFAAACAVPKSGETIGIRIRHKDTNEIIFDTGYKLVKFSTFATSTRPANFTEWSRWNSAGGGLEWTSIVATKPADTYMMINPLCRFVAEPTSTWGFKTSLAYGFDPNYPTQIFVALDGGDINGFDISKYPGCFIFATKGS